MKKTTKFNKLINETLKPLPVPESPATIEPTKDLVVAKIADNKDHAEVLFNQLAQLKFEAKGLMSDVNRLSVQTEAYVVQFMRLSFEIQRTMEEIKELVVFNELSRG